MKNVYKELLPYDVRSIHVEHTCGIFHFTDTRFTCAENCPIKPSCDKLWIPGGYNVVSQFGTMDVLKP